MSPEQDIKRSKFQSEREKAAINILLTASWLSNKNAIRLRPHGITSEQFNVLRILRGSYPNKLMLAEITSRMIDKSSNATRLVEKLRQKGLLKREICENNRRQVDITITGEGLSLLKIIDVEMEVWLDTLSVITEVEAREINRILGKLRD